ncbi:bestrophin-4-like isoform X2 [Macrobrachium nipponense]|uniref:bestrophin-4-like isoform X2 n=1 Tax=Macrobrachium nipponense TaxID=159736 RepID=UPI0030C7F48C
MTVSYQYDVASSTSGGFTRLLFKWRGSLYKLIYREFFIFCFCYACMSIIYRYIFTNDQKREFERAVLYCDAYMNYIPLSFILGFYVSFVASRWWQQYMAIPWPDKIIHAIALHVTGYDEKGRMMRRALARYLNLSLVLILRSISSAVKKRFPTLEHLVEAGFITSTELGIFNSVPNKEFNTYWVPCTWFTALLRDIKSQKRIPDPMGVKHIMEEFLEFRAKCGMLWCYDWVSLPLVYTQVVTIATYAFFMAAIVGRQYVDRTQPLSKLKIDLYIPFFTLLQFFVYMGLLKVAEQLINPFGDDDEDFELNWIIDRHMKVSYLIVDTLLIRTPPLAKDIFYDDESPVLPYTEASAEFKKRTYRGSVANMVIPEDKQNLILPDIIEEGEDEDRLNPRSNLASQMPSVKSSISNIAGLIGRNIKAEAKEIRRNFRRVRSHPDTVRVASKEQRSLSVPDDVLIQDGGSIPTLKDGLRESSRSQPVSRSTSRRIGTAGSKGIGSAIVAIGSHQGFLAADPEKVSLASGLGIASSTPTCDTPNKEKQLDELDYMVLPISNWGRTFDNSDSLAIDMNSVDDEEFINEKVKVKGKGAFRLPASIKARLAVKKKPVITWRPYIRQASRDQGLPEDLGGELAKELQAELSKFPDVLKAESSENISPLIVEDECAFMWRTVEDDNLSTKTSMSAPSDDQLLETFYQDTSFLSHYKDVKPSPPEQRPTSLEFGLPGAVGGFRRQKSIARRPVVLRRAKYRTRGRMRCVACSMPLLHNIPRESQYLISTLVRSISESSFFQEAVTRRVSLINRSQDRSRPVSAKYCPSPEGIIPPKLQHSDRQSESFHSENSKEVP